MKRTLLFRLHATGACCLLSTALFVVGIPLYQGLVLTPLGYSDALAAASQNTHLPTFLAWVGTHTTQFIVYRILLILAFGLLLTVPFNLFRIIVAQEIIGQQDREEEERQEALAEDDDAQDDQEQAEDDDTQDEQEQAEGESDGMPAYPWRGKGFAVLAAWAGFAGYILYGLGTFASTLYLVIVSNGFTSRSALPDNFSTLYGTFSFIANTIAIGLLALSALFFGAIITRSGRSLWPGIWVLFGYAALAIAALLSGSAVAVASSSTAGQAALTTPAIILFALWNLWLGIMLVRLKPEA